MRRFRGVCYGIIFLLGFLFRSMNDLTGTSRVQELMVGLVATAVLVIAYNLIVWAYNKLMDTMARWGEALEPLG